MTRHRRPTALLAVAVASVAGLLGGCSGAVPAVDAGGAPAAHGFAAPVPIHTTTRPYAGRLLVYGIHGFTAAEVAAVRHATGRAVAVRVSEVAVASGRPAYPRVPVETVTADPKALATAIGTPSLATALATGAVLSQTESTLRHTTEGGTLRLADGRTFRVTAVVEDHVLAGYEMALPPSAVPPRPGEAATYLLVDDAPGVAAAVHKALPDRRLRVEAHTANGFLSPSDSVLTQEEVKARFGEFAMRPAKDGPGFVPDPAWQQRYLVERKHVPQLGDVTCNKVVLAALTAAMREVTARGLGSTVHTADFRREGGCWNPRGVRFGGGIISRHTWGIAVDINVDDNPLGAKPHQDPRLVAIMGAHGFVWGGRWLRPDGAHFEYVGKG